MHALSQQFPLRDIDGVSAIFLTRIWYLEFVNWTPWSLCKMAPFKTFFLLTGLMRLIQAPRPDGNQGSMPHSPHEKDLNRTQIYNYFGPFSTGK